jgi:hypothetical protein
MGVAGGRLSVQPSAPWGRMPRAGITVLSRARQRNPSCSRPGTARRCEPPPAQRSRPRRDCASAVRRAAASSTGPRLSALKDSLRERLGSTTFSAETFRPRATPAGKAGQAARRRLLAKQLRPTSPMNLRPRKNGWGRRRFAPAQPGDGTVDLEGRRDENVSDARPSARGCPLGKNLLPPASGRPLGQPLESPRLRTRRRGAQDAEPRLRGRGYTQQAPPHRRKSG